MPDLTDRYEKELELGRAATAAMLADPAVRSRIEEAQRDPIAAATFRPAAVQRHVITQARVIEFARSVFGVRRRGPDGEPDPDPLDLVDGWPVGREEIEALQAAIPAVTTFVRWLAELLATEDVPIDPRSRVDLVALTSLLLLDIDWELAPSVLAEQLGLDMGVSAVSMDSRSVEHRDGRSTRSTANIEAIRAEWRGLEPDNRGDLLASKGGRPPGSRTEESQRLESALREVLARFPGTTAGSFRRWTGNGDTPGRMLRDLMGCTAADRPPAERSVERALHEIHRQ